MAAIDDILAGYEALRPAQEAFYQDLHRHPELSHQEHRTAQRVAEQLTGDGFAVTTGIGGTGVVGVLANGSGPTILLRCELDALPVREETGAPYASTVTVTDAGGHQVPVDHACGHDMHMACMIAMGKLMADHREAWQGTLITLFQPAEETGEGAQDMVDDGLFKRIPVPDVALAQHLLPGMAGTVRTRSGPFMSAADSLKVTVYGRGGHGSTPQNTVDPVVLAAMIIVRLQTVVSREVAPGDIAVVTVGSVNAGTRSNIIPDFAVLELNVRSYSAVTRQRMLDAIQRIIRAECQASGSPKEPEFETTLRFPITDNDPAVTERVAEAFAAHFGDKALRTLCRDGQLIYLAEARRALDSGGDAWQAFTGFLRRIVAASTHGLTVRLAGTFEPTAEQMALAEQMRALGTELFERARASGQLRPDITWLDVEYLMELLARVQLGDASRTAELRQRHLAVILDGLRRPGPTPLPGRPPTWPEQTERWVRR